jgi:hypothetical protein
MNKIKRFIDWRLRARDHEALPPAPGGGLRRAVAISLVVHEQKNEGRLRRSRVLQQVANVHLVRVKRFSAFALLRKCQRAQAATAVVVCTAANRHGNIDLDAHRGPADVPLQIPVSVRTAPVLRRRARHDGQRPRRVSRGRHGSRRAMRPPWRWAAGNSSTTRDATV